MKFNSIAKDKSVTVNHEGAKAYDLGPEFELYKTCAVGNLQNSFYESTDEILIRIREAVKLCRHEYVAKLAVYCREKMYMRSVPLVLMVELIKHVNAEHKGEDSNLLIKAVERVIQRADEITEILSYYQSANSKSDKEKKKLNKLSKSLSNGIANSFHKFDEYQFQKYNRDSEVKLKDAMFLTHPKPKDEAETELFKKIANDVLATPYTWEVELSSAKEKGKTKRQVWEELIDSDKLGYMALIRNLRNILEEEVSEEHIKKVCGRISDPVEIKKSKQFPFRFLSAYRAVSPIKKQTIDRWSIKEKKTPDISDSSKKIIMDALEKAVLSSVDNLSGFNEGTRVLIASDVSASMQLPISIKSEVMLYDIGLLLSMLLRTKCKDARIGIFGDSFKIKKLPNENVLKNINILHGSEGEVGYSTNGYLVIDYLINKDYDVDKVFIFTDCELWNSSNDRNTIQNLWVKYHSKHPSSKLYLFNLNSYKTSPLKVGRDGIYMISGWSDKIFDALDQIEAGIDAIGLIDKVEL